MKKRFLALGMCFILILGLCACSKKPVEDTTEYGEISIESEEPSSSVVDNPSTEISSETDPIDPDEIIPAIDGVMNDHQANIKVTTTNYGTCAYDGAFNFNGFSIADELQEITMIVSIPEVIIDDCAFEITTKEGAGISKFPVYAEGYKATGMTGNYMLIHMVAGKDINFADYRIKLFNSWEEADYILVPFTTNTEVIPEDISVKLINIEGKMFYYAGRTKIVDTVEQGGEIFVEGYYCTFIPMNCSFADFPYSNMTMKLADTVEKNLKRCVETEFNGRVDTFTLASGSGFGYSAISPVVEMTVKYDYVELRQFFGNFWAEQLAVLGDNLGFYYNNNLICNI